MIKIQKSIDGQFYVTYHGKNNQVLAVSETLKSKQSAIKNIKAVAGVFRVDSKDVIKVMDYTGKKEKEIVL